jgi:hypothetical protein
MHTKVDRRLCGHSSLEKYTIFFFKVGNLALSGAPAFGLLLCLVRVAGLSDCLVFFSPNWPDCYEFMVMPDKVVAGLVKVIL